MIQKLLIKIYGPDWKTSINGDLGFIITACMFITTYVVITPTTPKYVAWIVTAAGVVAAVCRAIVGRTMTDSGKVVVRTKDDEIAIVTAHETPDVKGVTPITPQK